jgi:RNA polymerase sigma-70 factor (ECF subfamily)
MTEPRKPLGTTSSPFPATRWTIVSAAQGEGARAERALNELCGLYWMPVYSFIRRKGNSPADAEDLTQGFFAELLERGSLASVAGDKGRLRTFLLKAVTRHLSHEYEKQSAAKRGGGRALLSLDFQTAEGQFIAEPGHHITPDLEFERQWALGLLERALELVRTEAAAGGREALFEDLKGAISLDAATAPYDVIAARHGISEAAVKSAAHRIRQSFRSSLRALIAETVCGEAEIDDEIQHLFTVFRAP